MKSTITRVVALLVCPLFILGARAESLSTLHAVHALTNAEAEQQRPAAFEATVTYFRSYEETLFVQDGDEGIYVFATTPLKLAPGDRIFVRGVTHGSFRPIVSSSEITLLRHGPPPRPVPAAFTPLVQSDFDCRYVLVRGQVRSAIRTLTSGRPVSQLELAMDGGNIGVTVDSVDQNRLDALKDAQVEVRAVASGRFDGKMEQTGILLHASSLANIRILKNPAADPWSIPVTRMDQVLAGYNVQDRSRRLRVAGTLTYYRQTQMAVLQDGQKSIRVLTPSIERLKVGDRVEATGFPMVDHNFLTLALGDLRGVGSAAPVRPVQATWDEVASGKHTFDLVTIEGSVVTEVREHAQDVYVISSQGHLFSASLRHSFVYEWGVNKPLPPMPIIAPGSRVKVTGVAALDEGTPFNGPTAFSILLRSASDVAVVAAPSPLNVRNLTRVATLLLLLVAIIGGWAWILQRKVHRQTVKLAAQIEAEADLERRRSRILEDINARRPLPEILEQVTKLVSFKLGGSSCWCVLAGSSPVGSNPAIGPGEKIERKEIASRSGSVRASLCASVAAQTTNSAQVTEALSMGAWLATMAIETRGLYSDLVHRSEFDLLTDVFNRFSLEKRLAQLIENAHTTSARFGLIYIDLDDFKQVNDQFGHRVGDIYLQQVAARMKHQLRPSDMLARLGGDEFAVLVAQVNGPRDLADIAERLEHCFDHPFAVQGFNLSGTASIGTAIFPDHGDTSDSLLSTADAAMYVSKKVKKDTTRSVA